MTNLYYYSEYIYILYPNKDPFEEATIGHLRMFDKALGTDKIREKFGKKFKVSDIKQDLRIGLNDYGLIKTKYHLYD